jgi:hypothetical protein
MQDEVEEHQSRAIDRALLVAAFISFGCGLAAMLSGLLSYAAPS